MKKITVSLDSFILYELIYDPEHKKESKLITNEINKKFDTQLGQEDFLDFIESSYIFNPERKHDQTYHDLYTLLNGITETFWIEIKEYDQ